MSNVAPIALDDWLGVQRRLVVIAPHPDDEVLACGGLLGLHAERGGRCQVVAVTDGEASHRGCVGWNAATLAAARRAEAELGLSRLGVHHTSVVRLGLPDGSVHRHRSRLIDALHALVRPDDLVVCTWRLDGHPDHDAAGAAAAEACAAADAEFVEAPVWMWHWADPADPRVPWHRMRALPLPPEVHRRKASALAEHVTQLRPRERDEGELDDATLDAAVLRRAARETEYFIT
jgi:LmbE family N-acetylglucosaminyl deacetylase